MYQSKDVLKDSFKVKQLDTPPPKKTTHQKKSNKSHTKQKQTWVVKDEG